MNIIMKLKMNIKIEINEYENESGYLNISKF